MVGREEWTAQPYNMGNIVRNQADGRQLCTLEMICGMTG
jgi:hypothetical protein